MRKTSLPGQVLPTEIILTIFEHVVEKEAWRLATLASVNKALRDPLLLRLFQAARLHTFKEFDQLILEGWPNISTPDGTLLHPKSNAKLALYQQFVLDRKLGPEFIDEHNRRLLHRFRHLPMTLRDKVDTLSFRILESEWQFFPMGLWAVEFFPNLKRLYVDSTLLPPYENILHSNKTILRYESPEERYQPGITGRLPPMLPNKATQIEAYALAGCDLEDVFGDSIGILTISQKLDLIFPKLKRLYLFYLPNHHDPVESAKLQSIAKTFDALTQVRLIVCIYLKVIKDPACWCAPEAEVYEASKGAMVIKRVVVQCPWEDRQQDMVSFMRRIIDDVEAEWAPEAYSGHRWHPSTRPHYVTGIPARASLAKRGTPVPRRMAS